MLVIGNGESPKGLNSNTFNEIKIGCNAIARDVDCWIVCVDRRMVSRSIGKQF